MPHCFFAVSTVPAMLYFLYQEDAKAEANDLLARVESKASKDHVKGHLEEKAEVGEVVELRRRVDR